MLSLASHYKSDPVKLFIAAPSFQHHSHLLVSLAALADALSLDTFKRRKEQEIFLYRHLSVF